MFIKHHHKGFGNDVDDDEVSYLLAFYLNTCCFFTVTIIDIIIIIAVVIIIVTAISIVIISPLSESIIVTMMKQDQSESGVLVLKISFCLHFMIFSMNIFVFLSNFLTCFFNVQLTTDNTCKNTQKENADEKGFQ